MVDTNEIMARLRQIASGDDHSNYNIIGQVDGYVQLDGYFNVEMLRAVVAWLDAQGTD